VPYTVLRNGWYTENYTAAIPAAVQHGALLGSAGQGRIASAARADYAAAAAAVLTGDDHAGRVYELAGDDAYTLAELAAEISRQSGTAVAYRDLPETDYRAALIAAGLAEGLAALLAESDVGASKGGLFDDGRSEPAHRRPPRRRRRWWPRRCSEVAAEAGLSRRTPAGWCGDFLEDLEEESSQRMPSRPCFYCAASIS